MEVMEKLASELNDYFRSNLRAIRMRKGMTQQELADRVGFHRVRIAELEAGRNSPSLDLVERVAEALETTPPVLLRKPRKILSKTA